MNTQHSGPAAVTVRIAGPECVCEQLAEVLAQILLRADDRDASQSAVASAFPRPAVAAPVTPQLAATRQAAARIAPAVLTQQGVRALLQQERLGAWEGLVHRRCQISGVLPQCDASAEALGRVTTLAVSTCLERRSARAGWEYLRTRSEVFAGERAVAVVLDDFARWTGADLREAAAPSEGRPEAQPPLTAADVRAWAQASGDHNPVHLEPGAAHAAGLPVPADAVLAHGLLVAALELAQCHGGQENPDASLDLRFHAPRVAGAAPVLLPQVSIQTLGATAEKTC